MKQTHTVPLSGRRIPVTIVEEYEYAGRPMIRVEAAAVIFPHRGTEGGWHSNRANYPAGCVRALCQDDRDTGSRDPEAEAAPEAEADIEFRLGYALLDAETPAEVLNPLIAERRQARGLVEVGR